MAAPAAPRHAIGIDLGTTNTVVAWADAADEGAPARVEVFPIPQLVRAGEVKARPLLPSAIYLPAGPELKKNALALPWGKPDHAVGEFAREQGGRVPQRLVASAKSWLCHPGVDRRAALLPFGAGDDVAKISPVRAQELILRHVAAAWRHERGAPLEEADVLLTVPASFDAVARDLTLEAARAAGLARVTLLEEPQAAFYAWLYARGDEWRRALSKGDVVLVCDVGGGTTDFSLIEVAERDGALALERIAVGEHLLLGGDNMDLALAHVVSWRVGGELDAWQSRALWHACRAAKEELFERPEKEKAPVVVGGRGTKLVGEQLKSEITQEDLRTLILDGFFPKCAPSDRPAEKRRAALVEMGLPFVADPAITRHLARFLGRHARPGEAFVRPRFVLFNGGVMKAAALRARIVEVLSEWTGEPVRDLGARDLDLAVAEGAAYYGLVRRGRGIRIRGGTARSYYVGIESAVPAVPGMAPPLKALCVVPFGMEEGTEVDIPGREFGLLTGETAEFRFFGSTTRKQDRPGDLLERVTDDLEELAPIETAIAAEEGGAQRVVPVTLRARLTEIGTLDLFCVEKDGSGREWKLVYNVRETESRA